MTLQHRRTLRALGLVMSLCFAPAAVVAATNNGTNVTNDTPPVNNTAVGGGGTEGNTYTGHNRSNDTNVVNRTTTLSPVTSMQEVVNKTKDINLVSGGGNKTGESPSSEMEAPTKPTFHGHECVTASCVMCWYDAGGIIVEAKCTDLTTAPPTTIPITTPSTTTAAPNTTTTRAPPMTRWELLVFLRLPFNAQAYQLTSDASFMAAVNKAISGYLKGALGGND